MRYLLATIAALLFALPAGAQVNPSPGEVAIDLASFGVGGVARPCEWVGIRLNITDRGATPRDVMIRLRTKDVDGDYPTYTRVIVTNPPLTQGVWLYAHLPRDASATFEVTANAAIPTEDGYRPGRLLGSTVVAPTGGLAAPSSGFMAVLGSRYMELYQYQERLPGQGHSPTMHEVVFTTKDLAPNDLPDRDLGLRVFDAIIWAEGDPIELTSERVQAVRDWVNAGGHLIVVMPPVGQTWLTDRNPLVDILPRVNMTRRDGVDLEPYRPLLSDRPAELVAMPENATVHEFEALESAEASEAIPVLVGPEGEQVVVRRLVGHGAVTLVGLDLNSPTMAGREALDPDIFWNRVLGKRGDLLKQREMTTLQGGGSSLRFPGRSPVAFDGAFDVEIAKTGRAAAGVLLGFIVFVLFWVVAGPGGFALLKGFGQTKHAWAAYAAATALFTVIAWGGATLIKPSRVDATYLRFVDHIYGQPTQRSRTWASILIPWYGDATISVGNAEAGVTSSTVVPWRPPSGGDASDGGFPDSRDYPMLIGGIGSITVPTRATVKNILADWVGEPAWAMPLPLPAEGETEGQLRLLTSEEKDTYDRQGYSKPDVAGVLVHDLPAALEDVTIIVVHGQEDLKRARTSMARLAGGQLLADARAYALARPWAPGEGLDLLQATTVPLQDNNNRPVLLDARGLLERLLPRNTNAITPSPRDTDLTNRLTALALYSMLEPPDPASRTTNASHLVTREQSHGWDLGRWFTQPCVIIIGHIPDMRDPDDTIAPIFVDGKLAPMRGRTVVRWVYPLPADPPEYPVELETVSPDEDL